MTSIAPNVSLTRTEPVVAAHRGASRLAPENTMNSFETALSKGATALELDVHLTSDDQLVVIHDSHLDRTTSGTGAVRSRKAEEVRTLDAGSWYGADFAAARVPTLHEVLDLTQGRARLNIELKASSAGQVAERVIETVCQHGATERVVMMSFGLDSVLAARRHLTSPRWHDEAAAIVVLPIVTQPLADPLAFVQATDMDGLNYPPQLWNADLIQIFRESDLIVHGGLINDPQTMREFFDRGGHMADTDEPELFGSSR
ncbi:MAG: glycerophosphodiester phosphodiesterase [Actinopolymorphaceae bacterium]